MGGISESIIELEPGESVGRWSGGGRYLFLQQREPARIKISRVEVAIHRKDLGRW